MAEWGNGRAEARVEAKTWPAHEGARAAPDSSERFRALSQSAVKLRTWLRAEAGDGRLLPWVPIAFGAGIAIYFSADREPVAWPVAVVVVVAGVAAFAMRRRTLEAIGALARGPGAERYQKPSSFADSDIANENAALIGTPDEIIRQLRQLQAGGVEYVLLIDASGNIQTLRSFAEEIMPQFAEKQRTLSAVSG